MTARSDFTNQFLAAKRLWKDEDYAEAMSAVEAMRRKWPGNPNLLILWASLVQLQDEPRATLADAKAALQQAVELDKESPAAAIELGYFLDNVEDEPRAATKLFATAADSARKLLLDALVGRARALRQIGNRDESMDCIVQIVNLLSYERRHGKANRPLDIEVAPRKNGFRLSAELQQPYGEIIEELLSDFVADSANQSAKS